MPRRFSIDPDRLVDIQRQAEAANNAARQAYFNHRDLAERAAHAEQAAAAARGQRYNDAEAARLTAEAERLTAEAARLREAEARLSAEARPLIDLAAACARHAAEDAAR